MPRVTVSIITSGVVRFVLHKTHQNDWRVVDGSQPVNVRAPGADGRLQPPQVAILDRGGLVLLRDALGVGLLERSDDFFSLINER